MRRQWRCWRTAHGWEVQTWQWPILVGLLSLFASPLSSNQFLHSRQLAIQLFDSAFALRSHYNTIGGNNQAVSVADTTGGGCAAVGEVRLRSHSKTNNGLLTPRELATWGVKETRFSAWRRSGATDRDRSGMSVVGIGQIRNQTRTPIVIVHHCRVTWGAAWWVSWDSIQETLAWPS